ncbi:MAG TPA: type IX secretion system membrane protein PorP/SprF [Cyclobacteriaceae bacterium]|nr:type IX secretion system membrane protein PorP/SprF [Cyclobacteriaceae bacterium]HRJ80855.1 type IX secretion system membrane protein PorP/SprF [Cyclobacteriaceae bacterium]
MKRFKYILGAFRSGPSHKADDRGCQPCRTTIKPFKILALLMFIILKTTQAQQDPLYSQYIFNPFIINPAYAGFSKDLTGLAAYRVQWAGMDGSPVTMNASGHMALADNRMGVGLTILQDKIGTNKTTEFLISYGYHISFRNDSRVSFGLQAGAINYRNDFNDLTIDKNDPKFQSSISEFSPSFGAGIIYSSDKFYLSVSVPKMLDGKTTTDDNIDVVLYSQQFYGMGSYLFTLSHRLKLKPFIMARYTAGAPVNTDFGVALNADDSYTLGLFTRSLHTYGAMMKINLGDMLRVGYIFELPTDKSVGLNYTAHEITVGIRTRLLRFHDLSTISDF